METSGQYRLRCIPRIRVEKDLRKLSRRLKKYYSIQRMYDIVCWRQKLSESCKGQKKKKMMKKKNNNFLKLLENSIYTKTPHVNPVVPEYLFILITTVIPEYFDTMGIIIIVIST